MMAYYPPAIPKPEVLPIPRTVSDNILYLGIYKDM